MNKPTKAPKIAITGGIVILSNKEIEESRTNLKEIAKHEKAPIQTI
jgi:hypothetical protein